MSINIQIGENVEFDAKIVVAVVLGGNRVKVFRRLICDGISVSTKTIDLNRGLVILMIV